MPTWYYFQCPSNLACHNLATTFKPPPMFRSLLGLGLSFCLRPFFTSNKRLTQMLLHFCHDLYNRFIYGRDPNSTYDPKLYARSNRKPPEHLVTKELIARLDAFETSLHALFWKKHSPSNLLSHQHHCLHTLRNDPNLMVMRMDKNLGPALIERSWYITLAFKDHLSH